MSMFELSQKIARLERELTEEKQQSDRLKKAFDEVVATSNRLQGMVDNISLIPGVLKGKVALVTGASRGIGRATAIALAAAGADVAINFQRSAAAAEEVACLAGSYNIRATPFQADVAHDHEARKMAEAVLDEFGHVDILVNNAGITRDKSFLKMTKAMWDEVLGVNLNGPFNMTQAFLPGMVERGWGRVINVSGITGQTGNFGKANYAVTKGGLIAFTMTLAREVSRKGVTVNAVAPGFIETDMVRDIPQVVLDGVRAMIPVGRLGRADEVAAAIVFLATPQASFISGQVVPVNGGLYM